MKYYDVHLHLSYITDLDQIDQNDDFVVCSSSHSINELNFTKTVNNKIKVVNSFGSHPQNPNVNIVNELERLLCINNLSENPKISAIGEIGFDLYTKEFIDNIDLQKTVWQMQLELAIKNDLPVIIHSRKALHLIFQDSKKLKKLPSVIFHSFSGSVLEAKSLHDKMNCFFSFGKQIFNNNKKVIDCVKNLPISWILAETDAPYQFLKGEKSTSVNDIKSIYNGFAILRCINLEEMNKILNKNAENTYLFK